MTGRCVEAIFCGFARGSRVGGAADHLAHRAQPRVEHRTHRFERDGVRFTHVTAAHQPDTNRCHAFLRFKLQALAKRLSPNGRG